MIDRSVIFGIVTATCVLAFGCRITPTQPDALGETAPDTTSHAVIWEIDTLPGSGWVNDVGIVGDSLVYLGGEMYAWADTAQEYPQSYPLARWNGLSWEFQRLNYRASDGQGNEYTAPLFRMDGIKVFGPSDIWLMVGSIFHWDGKSNTSQLEFSRLSLSHPNGMIRRLWGTSSTHFYAVGDAGSIILRDGATWQQIESGTTSNIRSIWGSGNEVLAVVSGWQADGQQVASISGTTVSFLSDSGISRPLSGIWFSSEQKYVVVGNGVFTKDTLNKPTWRRFSPFPGISFRRGIIGTDTNNVFVIGDNSLLEHYNGSTWSEDAVLKALGADFYSIDVKGRMIVVVGTIGSRPVIARGTQQ